MTATAPQITGEVLIGQLTDRLIALYAQALECEAEEFELKSMQRLLIAMAHKIGREFSALTSMLNRKDKFLNFWAGFERPVKGESEPRVEFGFEDQLKDLTVIMGNTMTLGSSEIVTQVKGLLLSFQRMVRGIYGEQHAAIISAKMKEFESRRVMLRK